MTHRDPILNHGSNPDSSARRSGGSVNDPHGGHAAFDHELRSPEPNPIQQLVPGGQASEAAPPLPQPGPETQGATETGRLSDDLGAGATHPGSDSWPSNVKPAVEPTSPAGLRREGMAEGGTNVGTLGGPMGATMDDTPPALSAYTGAQKPNLPDTVDEELGRGGQGSGLGQQPVERRANGLVFDDGTATFQVKDEEHGTGVTSQDHDRK